MGGAASSLHNGCRFECLVAGFKVKHCLLESWARYVSL